MGGAGHGTAHGAGPQEPERVVIRDKRRIDPTTGAVRTPATDPAADTDPTTAAATDTVAASDEDEPAAEVPPTDENATLLAERTADLQRLSAEYANYRKRAERDRLAAGELAVGRVLTDLLPVLDDIDRAREHGDLTGGLKAVADRLQESLTKLGLESFGAVGDEFDPAVHEAVLHDESADVTVPTCTTIMRPGYRHRDRLLRPAMVGVSDPA